MKNNRFLCFLLIFITFTTWSCKGDDVPVSSILESTSLRNGSVTLYNIKDKTGKVIKVIKNHILEETTEMYFVQEYSATNSEELIRIKLAPKTLNLNYCEIVNAQNPTADQLAPQQKVVFSIERSGQTYFLTSFTLGKPITSKIFYDSLVMEQENMVYLLNSFPFETTTSASIHFINARTQKEGTEMIRVEGKETKMFNKQEVSVYKVSLSALGGTAWYMEEKPHTLVEADLPSYTILLTDWNGF